MVKISSKTILLAAMLSISVSSTAQQKPYVTTSAGVSRPLPPATSLVVNPSTTTSASITIPQGVAPTVPQNGDVWTTADGISYRLNGTTRKLLDNVSPINTPQLILPTIPNGSGWWRTDAQAPNVIENPGRSFFGITAAEADGQTSGTNWVSSHFDHYLVRSNTVSAISKMGGTAIFGASRNSDRYRTPALSENLTLWQPGQAITAGQFRGRYGRKYIATTSGVTGATPPTHVTGSVSDGGVTWVYQDNRGQYFTPIGVSMLGLSDIDDGEGTWAGYVDVERDVSGGTIFGIEYAIKNKGTNVIADPFNPLPAGSTIGSWYAGGGDSFYGAPNNPSTSAMTVYRNSHTWNTGLLFSADSLTTIDGRQRAIGLANSQAIQWFRSANQPSFEIRSDGGVLGRDMRIVSNGYSTEFRGVRQNGTEETLFGIEQPDLSAPSTRTNQFYFKSSTTTGSPGYGEITVQSAGYDNNVNIVLTPKGDGEIDLTNSAGQKLLRVGSSGVSVVGAMSVGGITNQAITPVYNLSSNTLAVTNFLHAGDVTIPSGKQYNLIRMDGIFRSGDKAKGLNFDFDVYNSDDSYGVIGLLNNYGSGPSKSIYGRSVAKSGSTGVVVGMVSGVTTDSGSTPTAAYGHQISMAGTGAGVSNFGHTALKINTDNNILGILNGVIELDEGIFSDNRVSYSDAFIRAVNGTVGTDGTKTPAAGSFLKWQNTDGQFVFEVDKDGLIYQRSASGQQLFATDISGNLLLGSTAVSQRQLRLYTSATEYYLQGVSTGNYLRFRDNTVGKDLMKIYGVSGDVDIEGNIKPTIDDSKSLGTASLRYSVTYSTKHCYTATVCDYAGNGSPEGSLSSSVGSTYRRIDGGASTTFYVKESGSGNTGWVAK